MRPRAAAPPGLRLFVAARFVSVFGTGMAPIALAFAVLAIPDVDSPSALGLVLFASAVPQVLFMLIGGVAADRFSRSVVMVVAESLAGAAQLATAVLFLTGSATVPALVVLAAVHGTAIALFSPALTAIVPDVVPDAHLQSANAYLRLATNLARILGTALGGVLVATLGPGWALMVDGGSFLVAAALLALVRSPAPLVGRSPGLLPELRQGWREFAGRRWVVLVVVLFALSNMGFTAAVGVLGPVQAEAALGGAGPWAAIVTSYSLGTVLGVLVALRLRPSRPMAVAVLVVPLMAIPVAVAAPPLELWIIIVSAFFGGVAVDIFAVLWDTALQQNVPTESLSRVSAYDWLGSSALVPLGLAASGLLVGAIGVQGAILIAALLCALPGLAILDPQVRGLRAGRPSTT